MKMKKMKDQVLSIFLVLMLVFGVIPEVNATPLESGDSFTLGDFDSATNTFKDASGSGVNQYKTLMIAYGKEIYSNNTVTPTVVEHLDLPTVEGFVKNNTASTNYSTVISMENGKTMEEIADYVKQIVFSYSTIEGQEIQITITDQLVNNKTFYFAETKHYYQYIPYTGGTNSWVDAYNAAKNMTYAGRQGYLATVTSLEEDIFIYNAANTVGWLGGTVLPHGTKTGKYYDSFTTDASEDEINNANWYWACGPEIGTEFFGTNVNQNTGSFSAAYASAYEQGYYFNWDSTGEPTLNEPCLTTLKKGTGYRTSVQGLSNYSWNNLSLESGYDPSWPYSVLGYFVEFGDQSVGDSGTGANGVVAANGTIPPVTYTVTFDAGTGTGTMDPVTTSMMYELPQCTFIAPSGQVFVGWKDDYDTLHDVGEAVNISELNHFVAQWVNGILVNDGTDTNEYLPVYGYMADTGSKGQFIIPGDDLTDIVGSTITGMTFYSSNENVTWSGAQFEIYMLEVESTTISELTDWSTMTLVRNSGSLSIDNHKMTVPLDVPFVYKGGNLMIGVLETQDGQYNECTWYGVQTSGASYGGCEYDVSQQNFLPKTLLNYADPTYTVTLSGGANATHGGGDITQNNLSGAMTTVTYTANSGYYFPEFEDISNNGITATRTSDTVVTVSGLPTADASIEVPDAVAKPTIEVNVIFRVANGFWNDETKTDKIVTLKGYVGDTLKLAANQIPAVGEKPKDGYKAGCWNVTPDTDTAITAATTYTYTYAQKDAADIIKAPIAKHLTYTGSAQELVTAGEATGGEMQYALGDANGATQPYTTDIPTGITAGT